ncbi:Multidrug resistance-associated protein 1 [Araneus ventricosus]|uniref:Multidrug resistance-associated protein 1 n=1 Tax=Araneus ventricosus TaxID=182803 RepID=A0A4Y2WYH6_ARAVE|nr:Multidrug resistance-associated protein 1 [Araneus ventricosus]
MLGSFMLYIVTKTMYGECSPESRMIENEAFIHGYSRRQKAQKLHLNTFRQIRRLESTGRSPIYSLFMEAIQGVSSISAYDVKKDFIQAFEEKLDKCFVCAFNSNVCNRWLNFCLNSLGSVIVFVTTILAIQNREALSPAVMGLLISYSLSVRNSVIDFF